MARGGYYSVDSLKGVHVLVLDDEAEGRLLLASILNYCGALVTAVASAEEALAVMGLIKPDAIVVSLALPGDDGYGLLRRVRDLKPEDGGVIPIIAVGQRQADGERARRAGFAVCLLKPLDPWELCRVISTLTTAL